MTQTIRKELDDVYPACRAVLCAERWAQIAAVCSDTDGLERLPDILSKLDGNGIPPFLPELARLEWAVSMVTDKNIPFPENAEKTAVNPTVRLIELSWKNLTALLVHRAAWTAAGPEPGSERVLLWLDPKTKTPKARPATDEDLLVLKMIVEGISPEQVAAEGNLAVGAVDAAVDRAEWRGLLLSPPSRITRDPAVFKAARAGDDRFLSSPSFTLQWHITQACDLHCKHCYDRSDRESLTLDEAVRVLDDLRSFCRSRNVQGAVSFTGGNPLLHPYFTEIYRAAVDRGFSTAILGNPAPRERIEELIRIQMPTHFQVSLEGLREHNDGIRGAGHFDRIMQFLAVLKELNVSSMVMLTLTSGNMDQVVPLAGLLRDRTDIFHFNRLALFGEGARLRLPDRGRYRKFLEDYLTAAETNPVMGTKDNLINVIRHEKGQDLFGGCTGYGCGAAFNFISLLADGEVHACRKLPSPIGNIRKQSISEIYDSGHAKRYRLGPSSCAGCALRVACGGCLASAMSHGLDIFKEKDPFCFLPHTGSRRL
jgi:selenobiotic family peptide radical SAM maturase